MEAPSVGVPFMYSPSEMLFVPFQGSSQGKAVQKEPKKKQQTRKQRKKDQKQEKKQQKQQQRQQPGGLGPFTSEVISLQSQGKKPKPKRSFAASVDWMSNHSSPPLFSRSNALSTDTPPPFFDSCAC